MPADGKVYPLVTQKNWQIGCLPAIQNGEGQGFFAVFGSQAADKLLAQAASPNRPSCANASRRVMGTLAVGLGKTVTVPPSKVKFLWEFQAQNR